MIPDIKREVSNCIINLDDKAPMMEIERIQRQLAHDYTPLRSHTQLQQVVGQKAEWMDLNDCVKR